MLVADFVVDSITGDSATAVVVSGAILLTVSTITGPEVTSSVVEDGVVGVGTGVVETEAATRRAATAFLAFIGTRVVVGRSTGALVVTTLLALTG